MRRKSLSVKISRNVSQISISKVLTSSPSPPLPSPPVVLSSWSRLTAAAEGLGLAPVEELGAVVDEGDDLVVLLQGEQRWRDRNRCQRKSEKVREGVQERVRKKKG